MQRFIQVHFHWDQQCLLAARIVHKFRYLFEIKPDAADYYGLDQKVLPRAGAGATSAKFCSVSLLNAEFIDLGSVLSMLHRQLTPPSSLGRRDDSSFLLGPFS